MITRTQVKWWYSTQCLPNTTYCHCPSMFTVFPCWKVQPMLFQYWNVTTQSIINSVVFLDVDWVTSLILLTGSELLLRRTTNDVTYSYLGSATLCNPNFSSKILHIIAIKIAQVIDTLSMIIPILLELFVNIINGTNRRLFDEVDECSTRSSSFRVKALLWCVWNYLYSHCNAS